MAKRRSGVLVRRVNELEDAVARLFRGVPPPKKTKKRRKTRKAKVARKTKRTVGRTRKAARKTARKASSAA